MSPLSIAKIWFFNFLRLKNNFFCAAVVPILTKLHDLKIYSWIEALIHHIAYVASLKPLSGSNFLTACIKPMFPSDINSPTGRP